MVFFGRVGSWVQITVSSIGIVFIIFTVKHCRMEFCTTFSYSLSVDERYTYFVQAVKSLSVLALFTHSWWKQNLSSTACSSCWLHEYVVHACCEDESALTTIVGTRKPFFLNVEYVTLKPGVKACTERELAENARVRVHTHTHKHTWAWHGFSKWFKFFQSPFFLMSAHTPGKSQWTGCGSSELHESKRKCTTTSQLFLHFLGRGLP